MNAETLGLSVIWPLTFLTAIWAPFSIARRGMERARSWWSVLAWCVASAATGIALSFFASAALFQFLPASSERQLEQVDRTLVWPVIAVIGAGITRLISSRRIAKTSSSEDHQSPQTATSRPWGNKLLVIVAFIALIVALQYLLASYSNPAR